MQYWDFEKPIIELEAKIKEIKEFSESKDIDLSLEIKNLEAKLNVLKKEIYSNLTAWQKVQIARHIQRPTPLDYINLIMKDFIELHGDRLFGDDKAIVTGFAKLEGKKIAIVGHQRGKDTKENLERNFGCPHPEGYRKAMRIMRLAERFSLPIISFLDTRGAYPGIGAEERGQALAIAENIRDMFGLKTPIIVIVIGEGGSGGALGIGVGDVILIMQYAYYSVISPEGCAAILWRDAKMAPQSAEALKLTSEELFKLGVVDEIIPEPYGGAHRNYEESANNLKKAILKKLEEISSLTPQELLARRYNKFRKMGIFKG
ncbi:MAG: acetyl-CoA carboxylase carboxyltransferase subunit alpha [Candidatus Omnitrophica bacterium]|nr:acetyl-CoA carboxylase carboxyltransferase subunit alpha [Candidatus Omnitrophota bacterium]